MKRKKSRELAMKLLFESSINEKEIDEAIQDYIENNENTEDLDFDYIKMILNGIKENKVFLEDKIERSLTNWKITRLPKVNLAILKIACYEIFFSEDIPDKVSINEAIELAKKYSDDKAPSFINGVLGNMIKRENS